MSRLELTSMLDSLGSTLTRSTVSSFYTRFDKKAHHDDITIGQAIQCLEAELGRPESEKKRLDADDGLPESSGNATPVLSITGDRGQELQLDDLDFSGPSAADSKSNEYLTEPMQLPLHVVAAGATHENSDSWSDDAEGDLSSTGPSTGGTPSPGTSAGQKKMSRFRRTNKTKGENFSDETSQNASDSLERVINVKNCPLCHRPRLNSKAEIDIVTHLAVCASQDWKKVDRIVVGNFVTASQAQRKWYTNMISMVSSGNYKLGAVYFFCLLFFSLLRYPLYIQNSANIIVQNRITGQLEEEKMQVYVRLGIRLLYKGATSRMEGGRGLLFSIVCYLVFFTVDPFIARRLLKSLSIKQGIKYDAPESALDIAPFIAFHRLKVDEILDPPDSFSTLVNTFQQQHLTTYLIRNFQ
jgi:phosphatidylserine decarboxylase